MTRTRDVRQPDPDLGIAELLIQDAREYLPADADRVAYHLRQAQQLLDAHQTVVYVVPAANNSRFYHTDQTCERLPDGQDVQDRSLARVGRRGCCAVCAGETDVNDEPDWSAYQAARDAEVER